MIPEKILAEPARVLTQSQRERYFANGALGVPGFVDAEWLSRCNGALERLIAESAKLDESNAVFDLEPGHTRERPRLRRINSPSDHDPVFWEILAGGPLGDLAADLLGPSVKFYQSKLNFKAPSGGTQVRWHQDAPFFPHTNPAVLTIGIYLDDCALEQGPLETLRGTQNGPLYTHYDTEGRWRGDIRDCDVAKLPVDDAEVFGGPAGSVTAHNYLTVHGSKPNVGTAARPLLLYVLSAGDAMPYTAQPLKTRFQGRMVRGEMPRAAHHVEAEIELPPDWSEGYTSIFALQQQESPRQAQG